MKIIKLVSAVLVSAMILCGCGIFESYVYESENIRFTEEMAAYMVYYVSNSYEDEMKAGGVDFSAPLDKQIREDGESWADFLLTKTIDHMEKMALFCEAAKKADHTISDGMKAKYQQNIAYMKNLAYKANLSADEYVKRLFNGKVSFEAYARCTEMMVFSEDYELSLYNSIAVTNDRISAYADENADTYLMFDALRYTTSNKELADRLKAMEDDKSFIKAVSSVSGFDLSDKDKDGIPDKIEIRSNVESDDSGDFAAAEGRAVYDTEVTEKDGSYTVTMITKLPARDNTSVWDFRMIYVSTDSEEKPVDLAESLLKEFKDSNGDEKAFSSLAAKNSEDSSAFYGGLYSGIEKDALLVDLANWICSKDRVAGDTTIISNDDNTNAYVMYYVSGNIPRWQYTAMFDIRGNEIDDHIKALKAEIGDSFSVDEDAIRKLIVEGLISSNS